MGYPYGFRYKSHFGTQLSLFVYVQTRYTYLRDGIPTRVIWENTHITVRKVFVNISVIIHGKGQSKSRHEVAQHFVPQGPDETLDECKLTSL